MISQGKSNYDVFLTQEMSSRLSRYPPLSHKTLLIWNPFKISSRRLRLIFLLTVHPILTPSFNKSEIIRSTTWNLCTHIKYKHRPKYVGEEKTNRWHKYRCLFTKGGRKCSVAQGPHSEVVPRAFWRLVSKSCDECKGSFARDCEAKRWSHWTCSSLGTIFQPMRINSVPGVKCFCNNKNVLCVQSMVWHFMHHPIHVLCLAVLYTGWPLPIYFCIEDGQK